MVARERTHERVTEVLDRFRPFIQMDGGDIELVALEGDTIAIRLSGRCADCPSAEMTLHAGVERAMRRLLPGARVLRVR